MKNLKIKALVFCGIVMALGVAHADENRRFEAQVALERTPTVIVCRSKRCQAAGKAMSKQFLYNTLSSLLKANQNKKVALCEANPYTHVCLNDEIIFGADVGSANIQIALPSLSLIDVKKMSSDLTSKFIADYDFQVEGTYPECQATVNKLSVADVNDIFMETTQFACHLTSNSTTTINASYNVDYIDFDYGIIGAKYTIGLDQTGKGGKNGYALLRFTVTDEVKNECSCGCHEQHEQLAPVAEENKGGCPCAHHKQQAEQPCQCEACHCEPCNCEEKLAATIVMPIDDNVVVAELPAQTPVLPEPETAHTQTEALNAGAVSPELAEANAAVVADTQVQNIVQVQSLDPQYPVITEIEEML